MEEIDNIIIKSLREIGCNIDENITSLSNFDAEMVVEAVVKCIKVSDPKFLEFRHLTSELPPNMAARLRMATSLCNYFETRRYNGTIGYQTFLYPSETELRRLFPFLIEKISKEEKIEDTCKMSKTSQLEKSISDAVVISLSEPWLPHYCHKQEVKFTGQTKVPYQSIRLNTPSRFKKDEDFTSYYQNYQKTVPEQCETSENILPAVVSYKAKLLYSQPMNIIDRLDWITAHQKGKSSAKDEASTSKKIFDEVMSSKVDDSLPKKECELKSSTISKENAIIEAEKNAETEIELISKERDQLKQNIEKKQIEIEKLKEKLSQITVVHQREKQELSVLEEQKKMIARSYDLLEDGEANVEKLERIIETKKCKLINLATEWEETRKPLIQKYRDQKKNNSNKSRVDEIRLLQDKQQELSRELKSKDQQYLQLANEIQKVSKDTNRSAYTQRILEIINNIKKQKNEIDKVIEDTRNVKKEINNLTGRLERSYEVALKLCQNDQPQYNLVILLHSTFDSLIDDIKRTGEVIREIRDLEEKIDNESAKNVEANLKRITADLENMREEEASLKEQLKKR